MSKKKSRAKKRREQTGRQTRPAKNAEEIYRYGPLEMRHSGRTVTLSRKWKLGEYERHVSEVIAERPRQKVRIDEKIEEALSIVRRYAPFELLAMLAMTNILVDSENYTESSQENRLPHAEYAQSLVLSQNMDSSRERPSEEVYEKFKVLISEIYDEVTSYFGSEALEKDTSDEEKEIRFLSLLRHLHMRGDSYPQHQYDTVRGLFAPHDQFLQENYGFSTEDVIAAIGNVVAQVERNIRQQLSALAGKSLELMQMFREYAQQGNASGEDIEKLRSEWQEQPDVESKYKEFEAIRDGAGMRVFAIEPTDEAPEHVLSSLTARFGDNEAFATFEKAPGWPTNDTVITTKPLIEHEGTYYCFVPQLLMVNTLPILEMLIKEKDEAYLKGAYYKGRRTYLEKSALEYLGNLLPGAEIHSNLYYHIKEDGEEKRAETDGLVLYDNNLFIVEAKAGSLSSSTRRGSLERTRKDLSDLIDSAYSQALRTKRFIAEHDRPVFENEDGSEALVIEDKQELDNIVLVNVTLESLQHLSTQLSSLSAFDLIREQEWPWSVFINDLRVISEVVESPSEFLVYLKRRIRANDYPQFRAVDELDFLTYFFNEGLYFEDNYLKNTDIMQVTGYTDDLDLYYEYLAGRVAEAEKPRFKVPDDYRELVARVESTGKKGRTKVSTALLECDSPTFEFILNGFRQLKSMIAQDGRDHDFTAIFREPFRRGITFMVTGSASSEFWEGADRYCKLKKYQTRSKEWMLVVVETSGSEENYDCRVYEGEWQHDPDLERAVEMHKKRAVETYLQHNRKIDRNDPCPCNSGLKYKKCCGRN